MNPYFLFFSHFLKNPKAVGAAAPLSQGVIDQIVKPLSKREQLNGVRILEVGAGIGNVTQSIKELLSPKDHLDIIEINSEYCRVLEKRFNQSANVSIHCLSVIDWKPGKPYDFIISTLPFNSFDPLFVKEIFSHYTELLNPTGILSYVEYIGLQDIHLAFSKGEKRDIIHKRKGFLLDLQKRCLIEKKQILGNFPPCNIYHMSMHKNACFA
ncbi:MAG: class I SAM-dependent methyltransferase [Parachlamydiaceae bacterium]